MARSTEPPKLRRPKHDGRTPARKAPPGACDTHFHIYEADIPLKPDRRYTPVEAGLENYRRMAERLGLERGVVITGSGMTSNVPSLAAIAAMGGAFKGLALVKPETTDAEIEALAEGGMTGFRISTRSVGGLGPDHLPGLAERVADLGWHVEIHLNDIDEVVALLPTLRRLPIPYSIDHVGYLTHDRRPGTPQFEAVKEVLAGEENAYVNLYAYYDLSAEGPPDYGDMVEIVGTLVEARPDRAIWGTNWPHPSFDVPVPDDADLLDFIFRAVPDEDHRHQVLVDNPARLYGWDKDA
ncbi:MAG: amidohydrolase family protein [Alphaproteobacteria bacterium]|nr:amidohydrolase family protein [Alphaproteobacteria bacterium]